MHVSHDLTFTNLIPDSVRRPVSAAACIVAFCEGGSARDWWATEAWGWHKLHDQQLTSRQSRTCTYMSLNARVSLSPRAPQGPRGPNMPECRRQRRGYWLTVYM